MPNGSPEQPSSCLLGRGMPTIFLPLGKFQPAKWGFFNRRKLGNFQPALTIKPSPRLAVALSGDVRGRERCIRCLVLSLHAPQPLQNLLVVPHHDLRSLHQDRHVGDCEGLQRSTFVPHRLELIRSACQA